MQGTPHLSGPPGKPRGFAFVGFTSRGDAEKAIALVNGQVRARNFSTSSTALTTLLSAGRAQQHARALQKLGSRVAVVDWAVAKSHYQLQPGAGIALQS